ncbi:hypothetical protein A3742_11800 [Oleiphilus sp. HI0071]|jgi:hypothetical protein|uniref:DUF2750 domain-containing protein n=1 Tax=unclassified Oleiphilus TaxID=2631174 RepID=UPI0007C3CB6C|nr:MULTISPECIES: DUF2750 domain-containing protein [unclassified Oleiphilus]KZY59820.1 hypothetical protein A3737_23605 [Oleiphilus sp. HI0065]KZY81245.1 hypothetical protein A3742_11800 [Oleiphilus sp. HI0071]KZY92576.1 hypothetical protein A3744_02440 [Oleiphilus sp. HI0073]KZZ50531.1 hypothetical protein A3758_12575 [Oleiphilus sp. HI0118]KZZ52796.1 hypothetical protein A3760_17665 [Oleiphilus sp. HI0122]KZZ69864.1 hypothetical protein A3765_03420 [Oleiphilus sp. HI0130]KZZ78349.1 hypothe
MSQENPQELYDLDCESRYEYSLIQIVEEREVWILINQNEEFLKIYSEDEEFEYLPVWPSESLAVFYAQGETDLEAKCLSLPKFLKDWVPGLTKDKLEIGVFPGLDATVWVTEAEDFKNDIQEELSNL